MTAPVYLDHNATSPLRPEARDAMAELLRKGPLGNPSSVHRFGAEARYLVEKSRQSVARSIDCDPEAIVFTSGGTESDNLALRGTALSRRALHGANHVVTSATDHKAVLDTCLDLRDAFGFDVTVLPADEWGRVRPDDLANALRDDTAIVSIIHSNNETGAINDVARLASIVHARNGRTLFHTDAVQTVGRLPFSVRETGADLVTLCGHKFGAPVGLGLLIVRPDCEVRPQITGGGQEAGVRGGTENVLAITGFAAALGAIEPERESTRHVALRSRLLEAIREVDPAVVLNSPLDGHCLPGTLNVSFPSRSGQRLVAEFDRLGIALSAGSACTSGGTSASHVISAMSEDEARRRGALRISLGWSSTAEDVERFIAALPEALAASEALV